MMMRSLRAALALAIALLAAVGVYRLAYLPWRADGERKRLETITLALWDRQPVFGNARARANIGDARRYLDQGIHNTGLYMAAAANYRYCDDLDDAATMYRQALVYDRRPELYYNLGLVELARGRAAAAKEALIRAALFNPYLILDIADQQIQADVQSAVAGQRQLPWLGRR